MVRGSYTDAVIVSPANDTAVRNNAGNLTVRGQVSPKLASGHRVQLLLDGVPQGAPRRTLEFSLENIDRGTHHLQVRIVDSGGQGLVRRCAEHSSPVAALPLAPLTRNSHQFLLQPPIRLPVSGFVDPIRLMH